MRPVSITVFLLLVAVSAFLSPVLALAIVGGIVLGLLLRQLAHFLRRSRWARLLVLAILPVVVVIVAALSTLMLRFSPSSSLTFRIEAAYEGIAVLSEDGERWIVEHRFLFNEDEVSQGFQRYAARGTDLELEDAGEVDAPSVAQLQQFVENEGWEPVDVGNDGVRYRLSQTAPLVTKTYGAVTVNSIPIVLPSNLGENASTFFPGADSMLKVQAPRLTLLSTYPVAAERADLLQDGWEVLWIPVASTSQVRVEVLHPLLRWPFGPSSPWQKYVF